MKRVSLASLFFVLALSVSARTVVSLSDFRLPIPLGLIEPDIPIDSRLTPQKVNLGRRLFFDSTLSKDSKTSCATCHDPKHAFADTMRLPRSAAGSLMRRNSQSLANVGFLPTLSWDGRHRTLESQALEPFTVWGDMSVPLDVVLGRLAADRQYREMFSDAFGSDRPTALTLGSALASYQRSLLSGDSRFDRFLFGRDEGALTPTERRGYELFVGTAGCINCHDIFHKDVNSLGGGIALFTDFRFHNLGIGYANGRMRDVGRYEVTRDQEDWGAFRTPSLRNVALTAPYMHDGSLATLEEVIDFYDRGGTDNPNKTTGLTPLYLQEADKVRLKAFLNSLTSREFVDSTHSSEACGRAGPMVAGVRALCP